MRKEIANFFYSSEASENNYTEPEPDIPILAPEPDPSCMLNQ